LNVFDIELLKKKALGIMRLEFPVAVCFSLMERANLSK
jgi:hypothetical protein